MPTRRVLAFGATVAIEAEDPELFVHLRQWLPAFEEAAATDAPHAHYRILSSHAPAGLVVMRGRRALASVAALPDAARELAADLVVTLSRTSRDWTFIHAGVVAIDGRAIILPGASHAGKSTLVSALLREGAEYGSDEFAVIDHHGCVRSWARWLGMRRSGQPDERVDPAHMGARIMDDDVPVGAIVFTSFHAAGANVDLRPVAASEAALRLLPHCLTARARTARTLRALRGLVMSAPAFESPRSGAAEFAALLLTWRAPRVEVGR